MPKMTDPSDALISFQQAYLTGKIPLQKGELDPNVYVHMDRPNGEIRLTYVRLIDRAVTAIVIFVQCDPLENLPCFSIGYAVPEPFRRKGLAKTTIRSAIEEMKMGLKRNGVSSFYIEAIVGDNNEASRSLAEQTISKTSKSVVDQFSGQAAQQYLLKVE